MIIYSKVLVPVDGSKLAECVLPHVETLAEKQIAENIIFARVIEVTKVPTVGGGSAITPETWMQIEEEHKAEAVNYLNDLKSRINIKNAKVRFETLPPSGAADMITQYAKDEKVDLIVMATHGRTGLKKLVWGSVADYILKHANIPTLIIRAHCIS
jgi:nucleotide-binding universal stress UspA family protein